MTERVVRGLRPVPRNADWPRFLFASRPGKRLPAFWRGYWVVVVVLNDRMVLRREASIAGWRRAHRVHTYAAIVSTIRVIQFVDVGAAELVVLRLGDGCPMLSSDWCW